MAVFLAVGAVLVPAAQGRPQAASADVLLETITVDPGAPTLPPPGKVTLTKGTRYTLEVSGTDSVVGPQGFGYNYDALYCYGGIGFDHPECQPPTHSSDELQIGITGCAFRDHRHVR